jgi:hypothetical protein
MKALRAAGAIAIPLAAGSLVGRLADHRALEGIGLLAEARGCPRYSPADLGGLLRGNPRAGSGCWSRTLHGLVVNMHMLSVERVRGVTMQVRHQTQAGQVRKG